MKWLNPFNWFTNPTPPEPEEVIVDDATRLDGKFMLIQAGFEDDGRLRLEVEYDDAFVQSLRTRGYIGTDDHQLVMKYVGDVYRTISSNADTLNYD